jgi:hypothetical protein
MTQTFKTKIEIWKHISTRSIGERFDGRPSRTTLVSLGSVFTPRNPSVSLYYAHHVVTVILCFWTHNQRVLRLTVHCYAGEQELSQGLSDNLKKVRFGTIYVICRETVCAKASDAVASSRNDEMNSTPCKLCAAPTEQRCVKVSTGFRDERGTGGET